MEKSRDSKIVELLKEALRLDENDTQGMRALVDALTDEEIERVGTVLSGFILQAGRILDTINDRMAHDINSAIQQRLAELMSEAFH